MSSKWKGKQPVHQEPAQYTSPRPEVGRQHETAIDVTETLRALILEDDFYTQSQSTQSTSLSATLEGGVELSESGCGKIAPIQQRPLLVRKTATAPPGSLFLALSTPQPPRRAISARGAGVHQGREVQTRRSDILSPLLPRLSQLGTPDSRSLITRRKSKTKSGQRPKRAAWRAIPPRALKEYESIAQVLEARTGGSFSQRPRVKERLKSRKVRNLNTEIIDFKKKELPGTPGSITKTPRELYGEVDDLQPVKPLGLGPILQARLAQERLAKQLKTLDIWKQQVYSPGPIQTSAMATTAYRTNSTATLESFTGAVEGYSKARRASDDAALDEVVAFFTGFGIVEQAGPDELDRYWEPAGATKARHVPVKAMKTLGVEEEAAPRPGPSPRSSTPPSLSPNSGQRVKLRRLIGLMT